MLKEPHLGRVKTRLAREIGSARATYIYRFLIAHIVRRLARDPRWRTVLAVAPRSALRSTLVPHDVERRLQSEGDVGQRMTAILGWRDARQIAIVGTDLPGLHPRQIEPAFRALGVTDAVLGPAEDGGFWLIGLGRNRTLRSALRGVPWSSSETLKRTVTSLKRAGARSIALVARQSDLDETRDLWRHTANLGRLVLAHFDLGLRE